MTQANKRTSVMYILNVIHTTAVLVLQLIASPSLAEEYTVLRTDLIRIAATIVSLLYLFEIIYRESMRTQMLVHHFAVSNLHHLVTDLFVLLPDLVNAKSNLFLPLLFQTLFAICLVAGTLDTSHHPSLIVTALVWLFQVGSPHVSAPL